MKLTQKQMELFQKIINARLSEKELQAVTKKAQEIINSRKTKTLI